MAKERNRIGKVQALLMISLAVFFDIVHFILDILVVGVVVNSLLSIIIFLIFWFWFAMSGVSYTKNPKMFRTIGIGSLVAFIPILNALPEVITSVVRIIYLVREEDRLYNKNIQEQNLAEQKKQGMRMAEARMNIERAKRAEEEEYRMAA